MKILHIDDHPLFSKGLQAALSHIMEHHTFISARDCEEAISLIESDSPDLILLDLYMPGVGGIDFMHVLIDKQILIPVAICSASEDAQEIQRAFKLGAIAYLPKDWSELALAKAIDDIEQGEMVIPQHIQALLDTAPKDPHQQTANISNRQQEVLKLIAQGLSNKEIGKALGIGENTVKTHVKALFQACNSKNRVDCVNRARKLGLLF